MNTRFVEAFLWAARLGSFRAASDRLHITQAAVSNRVASLEEDIGARLFERDARELRLTPVGVRLTSRVRSAVSNPVSRRATVVWLMPKCCAAEVRPPCRATARKMRMSSQFSTPAPG